MRRDFLKLLGLAGLRLAIPFRLDATRAEEQKDEPYPGPYYVVFNASGGWDTTYLMDPKGVNEINRLYKEGDILTHGAHKFAPIKEHAQGGMCNEDFYAEFGPELLTLNGLDYSVNNHSPGARYMATGKLDSLAYPTFAALVAACRGSTCPLAFLTFGNYSATGNLVAMSRVPYLPSLQKIASADAVEGNEKAPYHDKFALDRIEQSLRAQHAATGSTPRLPRAERGENMLYAAQVNSKALQRVTQYIPKTSPKERLSQQAEIALASFKAGVCVSQRGFYRMRAALSARIGCSRSQLYLDTSLLELVPPADRDDVWNGVREDIGASKRQWPRLADRGWFDSFRSPRIGTLRDAVRLIVLLHPVVLKGRGTGWTREEIAAVVHGLVRDNFGINIDSPEYTEDTRFHEDMGVD